VEGRLRVGARVPVTRAEGPGARYAVWLQGCSLRCVGCCNPHLFEPAAGVLLDPAALVAEMRAVRGQIEGLTLLGGEPIDQAEALVPLLHGSRALGLSVMLFSGFTLAELHARPETAVHEVLALVDVLVDGRYDASRPEPARLWAGSANQRFHYLTDRYSPAIERPARDEPLRTVEVRVGMDGRLSANGWPVLRRPVFGRAVLRRRG
jgi:anaerobic ribonucleoside-triphosphate reductase activating protein